MSAPLSKAPEPSIEDQILDRQIGEYLEFVLGMFAWNVRRGKAVS